MTPSRVRISAVGGGDFTDIGEHLFRLAVEAGHLQPSERILDVGCGIGRLAVPLTRYITTGEYTGFDVSASAIRWCRRAIAERHPNFSFRHVDVYNSHYNVHGTIPPTDFVFPCANESVDLAFLGSILTHMTPAAAARYVAETSRVLKPRGRAIMTFFLLDDAVRDPSRNGSFVPTFGTYPEPWWAVTDPDDPEAAVAYDITIALEALRSCNLAIATISRGAWSVHAGSLTYQDLVVVQKNP